MDRSYAPQLQITFPRPGFYVTDVRMTVLLDGQVVYDGSFLSGIDLTVPVQPGAHRVTTKIDVGGLGIFRTREYDVTVPPGRGTTLHLEYSRFWGNFSRRPRVVAWPG